METSEKAKVSEAKALLEAKVEELSKKLNAMTAEAAGAKEKNAKDEQPVERENHAIGGDEGSGEIAIGGRPRSDCEQGVTVGGNASAAGTLEARGIQLVHLVHRRHAANGRIQSRVGERNARIREIAPSDRATKERSGERCGQNELRGCHVRPAGWLRPRRKRRKIRRRLLLLTTALPSA